MIAMAEAGRSGAGRLHAIRHPAPPRERVGLTFETDRQLIADWSATN